MELTSLIASLVFLTAATENVKTSEHVSLMDRCEYEPQSVIATSDILPSVLVITSSAARQSLAATQTAK